MNFEDARTAGGGERGGCGDGGWGMGGGGETEMESRKKRMLRLPCITHDSRTRLCQKSLACDAEHALNTFIPFLCARMCVSETEVDIKEGKKRAKRAPIHHRCVRETRRYKERRKNIEQPHKNKVEPRAANQDSELFEYISSSGNITCRYILCFAYYSVQ